VGRVEYSACSSAISIVASVTNTGITNSTAAGIVITSISITNIAATSTTSSTIVSITTTSTTVTSRGRLLVVGHRLDNRGLGRC
jgi:hypothetical protein